MAPAGVREIKLTKGAVALVDEADFDWLNQWKWCSSGRYATRRNPAGGGRIHMHREVAGTPSHLVADHINGNGHDNRRANLRNCTMAENVRNRHSGQTTQQGFIGVVLLTATGKYQGRISLNRHTHYTASFHTAVAAAIARDAMARELHGEFATLNFPDHCIEWQWRPHTTPRAQPGFRKLLRAA